jgi:hypothetical protein
LRTPSDTEPGHPFLGHHATLDLVAHQITCLARDLDIAGHLEYAKFKSINGIHCRSPHSGQATTLLSFH